MPCSRTGVWSAASGSRTWPELSRRERFGSLVTRSDRMKSIMELAMKSLEIVPSDRTRLYSAMIKKQAEIRRSGFTALPKQTGLALAESWKLQLR